MGVLKQIWLYEIYEDILLICQNTTMRVNGINVNACSLLWRHNGHDCVPNHQPRHCLLNCLFGRRSNKTSKLRVTGLCVGNSSGTSEFPAQMASNAENVSIWWRHHFLEEASGNMAHDALGMLLDVLYFCMIHIMSGCQLYRLEIKYSLSSQSKEPYPAKQFQYAFSRLTQWGRVTHICVGNLSIIGSDNRLSPGRHRKPLPEPMLE